MNNKPLIMILTAVALLAVLAILLFVFQPSQENENSNEAQENNPVSFSPLNATYIIEGEPTTLINGQSETLAAPGSAVKIITKVFGQPIMGDLNGDGKPDAALIIFQSPGGTGTFYYVVAAINTANGAAGTNGIFLGDRIAPQNIEIKNGQIIANYADRKPDEPFSTPPSVGTSKYINLNGIQLKEGTPIASASEHCGGNSRFAPTCITGYHCAPNPSSTLPFGDVGGICIAN